MPRLTLLYSRTKSLILLAFVCIFISSCSAEPDFYLIDGNSVSFTEHKDQYLVINYWAEWCKPCLEEVPELNAFYAEYGAKYPLYAVSFDKASNEQLSEQQKRFNMVYPMIASEPKPNIGIEMPGVLPANFIRAPSGKLYGPLLGPQTEASLLAAIERAKFTEANGEPTENP